MSGYIVHRPDRKSPWLARFAPKGGRIVSKSFRTRKLAEEWLRTQGVDRSRGEWMDPRAGQVRFSVQAERWMASRRSNRRSTAARDESVLRSLVLPYLGERPVGLITVETIEEWIDQLVESGKAPATIHKAAQLASGVLASAVRARRLARNPAEGISLPPLEKQERRFLSADEIWLLADAIDPSYRALVLLGAYGGLRLGELAALRVSSFGVGLRTVTVTETLSDVRGRISIGAPKTRSSIRTVALPAFVIPELEAHLASIDNSPGALLFTAPMGGPLRFSAFRQRAWAPAVRAAGLEWCTPHALRHSQAALLIEAGEDPYVISKRLGHASIRTTYDVYGHLLPSADEAAAEKLDAISRTRRAPSQVVEIDRARKTQS